MYTLQNNHTSDEKPISDKWHLECRNNFAQTIKNIYVFDAKQKY